MNDKAITAVVEEAKRILQDYPHLKYQEAVNKAKEVLGHDTTGTNKAN